MTNIAILVGNSTYQRQSTLDCCHNDLAAMAGLLEATGRYANVATIEDTRADDLKTKIREALAKHEAHSEIFFYFTGHGMASDTDFYLCATDFDENRPNETGLSNSELYELLRTASPELVVKITDACNSGTLLIKASGELLQPRKTGLKHIIQISSCLESQSSLAGTPLSAFTERFCLASLRKTSGPVYYSDIINTLRDDYLNNGLQTPHFVSQGTGREFLVEDGKILSTYRSSFATTWLPDAHAEDDANKEDSTELTLLDELKLAEEKLATPEVMEAFVGQLFDGITSKLSTDEFGSMFSSEAVAHSDFLESATRGFIIRVLAREKRQDNFVFADVERTRKKRRSAFDFSAALASLYDDDYVENWVLELNCKMSRVQLRISLIPRYKSLKKIDLVITCAPSLENCYIFEMATAHSLVDFGRYDESGEEVVRKWYKRPWNEAIEWLCDQIIADLRDTVRKQLEETRARLSKEE